MAEAETYFLLSKLELKIEAMERFVGRFLGLCLGRFVGFVPRKVAKLGKILS